MKTFLTISLLIVSLVSLAQKQATKWQYFGLHQAGLLTGSNAERPGIMTTNGISKQNWYVGISTGIDWYGLKTVPVLLSLHKAFGSNRHQPFVYGNTGLGFVWEKEYADGFSSMNYKNGFAGEAGLGYFINLKNKTALTLSAGYSYKQLGRDEKLQSIIDVTPYGIYTTNEYHYRYHYRRIAIRLGIKI